MSALAYGSHPTWGAGPGTEVVLALRGNWTKTNIEALTRLQLRSLRANAERAGDQKILEWCDEALLARAKKPSVKRAAKPAAKPAT